MIMNNKTESKKKKENLKLLIKIKDPKTSDKLMSNGVES